MQESEQPFPCYRKLKGINHYYRIDSPELMTELIFFGKQVQCIETRARIYPDRLLIQDVIHCRENRWEEISEEDFSSILANSKSGQ